MCFVIIENNAKRQKAGDKEKGPRSEPRGTPDLMEQGLGLEDWSRMISYDSKHLSRACHKQFHNIFNFNHHSNVQRSNVQ